MALATKYEFPTTVYGALDSALAADGGAVDAHSLRELARGSNRLLQRGEMLASVTFRGTGEGVEDDEAPGVAFTIEPAWVPLPSFTIMKAPRLSVALINVVAQVDSGVTALFFLGTRARPFDPGLAGTSQGVLPLAGTGTHKVYPPADGDVTSPLLIGSTSEELTPWIHAPVQGVAIDTSPLTGYGGVASGDLLGTGVGLGIRSWIFKASGAAWNTTGKTLATRRVIAELTQLRAGIEVTVGGARWVIANEAEYFGVHAPFDVTPVSRLVGGSPAGHRFKLTERAKVRIDGISVWAQDRGA